MQVSFCRGQYLVLGNSSTEEKSYFNGQEMTRVHVVSAVDLTSRPVEFYKPVVNQEEVKIQQPVAPVRRRSLVMMNPPVFVPKKVELKMFDPNSNLCCELDDKFYMVYYDKTIMCIDFGKLPLMKQLKLVNGQPVYPVITLPEIPVKIWTHKNQFFVQCIDNNLHIYSQDWKLKIQTIGSMGPGDTLHFNKGLMHIVRQAIAGKVNQVSVYHTVPQGDWQLQCDTVTKEVNKEAPNDVSILGNFYVHAS